MNVHTTLHFDECFDVMEVELAGLVEWLRWKKLQLKVSKAIITTRQISDLSRVVSIDGEITEQVEAIKYLGQKTQFQLTHRLYNTESSS